MNVHKNARLTPSGRVLLVQRIERGWPVRRAACVSGVSERTAHRWLGRYRAGDLALADRSSAPRRCPYRLGPAVIGAVERLRRQRQSGLAIAHGQTAIILQDPHAGIGGISPVQRLNNLLGKDS